MTTTPDPTPDPIAPAPRRSNAAHVLWLDLETTHTDPHDPYASVLEVGAIVTLHDPVLTEVARASLLIRPPGGPADHAQQWARMLPVVQEMHTASGLWFDATTSPDAWDVASADRAIVEWLAGHVGGEPVPVAGSGVGHLDLPFVKAHLPQLATRLTYWPIDTGNYRRMLQLAGRDDLVDLAGDVDAKPHRGLGDVELHVAEARRYLQVLGGLPPA